MEEFTNNNSGNLANAIKGLEKFDGHKPSEFRDWHKKLVVILGVTRRDIALDQGTDPSIARTCTVRRSSGCLR